jgi:hypothetical protein
MKKLFLLLVFFYLVSLSVLNAQSYWQKFYGDAGDDYATCMKGTSDGGYIIAGSKWDSSGHQDIMLLKTDGNGDLLWQKTYNAGATTVALSIAEASDGGFVIYGLYDIGLMMSYFLFLKVDINGNFLWTQRYTGLYDVHGNIESTSDNGFIVSGELNGNGIMKLDSTGMIVWHNKYINVTSTIYTAAVETKDNKIVIVTRQNIMKLDLSGNLLWNKNLMAPAGVNYGMHSLTAVSDSGCIFAYSNYSATNAREVTISRYNAVGDLLWKKEYGLGPNDQFINSIKEDSDGGFVMTGTSGYPLNSSIIFMKIDTGGNVVWSKFINNTSSSNQAMGLEITSAGDYVITGFSNLTSFGTHDAILLKTDSSGNGLCTIYSVPCAVTDIIIVDSSNFIYVIPDTVTSLPVSLNENFYGTTSLCLNTSVSEINAQSMDLYPSPASDHITVSFSEYFSGILKIFSSTGALCKTGYIDNTLSYSFDFNLPPGMYIATFKNDKSAFNKKFLVVN